MLVLKTLVGIKVCPGFCEPVELLLSDHIRVHVSGASLHGVSRSTLISSYFT